MTREKRRNPRLRLYYPIETRVRAEGEAGFARSVTANLGARGAYFRMASSNGLKVGQKVSVRIVVPHGLRTGGHEVRIHMWTDATVLRLDRIGGPEARGEDGVPLLGVALCFERALEFRCDWV